MGVKPPENITKQVQIVLAAALQVPQEEISSELSFGDIPQWDSLGHMEVMMRLEESFGIEINADSIANLVSVPAICKNLGQRIAEGN